MAISHFCDCIKLCLTITMPKKPDPRILFEYSGELFKFMKIFPSKSDESLYFHIYDDSTSIVQSPKTHLEDRGDNKIDLKDYIETGFQRHKISYHQSGIIHSTNKNRERLRDGVTGIPFNEIDISKLILVILSKKVDLLPKENGTKKPTDIILKLPESISPFTIHFDVYRQSRESELDTSNPNLLYNFFLLLNFKNKEFGLRIYLQRISGASPPWPPFNIILHRIG